MKIQDDKSIKQVLKPEPHKASGGMGDNFKNILSDVQSKIEESRDNKPLRIDTLENPHPNLQSASALDRLNAASFSASLGSNERSTVKKVEHLLDVLESYSQALADPKKNLRDIEPLVALLEQEKGNIASRETTRAEGDALNNLVTQALILTQVEVSRFNRGDYL
jgi:hypothetical protein